MNIPINMDDSSYAKGLYGIIQVSRSIMKMLCCWYGLILYTSMVFVMVEHEEQLVWDQGSNPYSQQKFTVFSDEICIIYIYIQLCTYIVIFTCTQSCKTNKSLHQPKQPNNNHDQRPMTMETSSMLPQLALDNKHVSLSQPCTATMKQQSTNMLTSHDQQKLNLMEKTNIELAGCFQKIFGILHAFV